MARAPVVSFNFEKYCHHSRAGENFFTSPYDERTDPKQSLRIPHRHDFYELIWLVGGSGTLRCDLREWAFSPGTLFFAVPGRIHCWQSSAPMTGYTLGFAEDFFQPEEGRPGLPGRLAFFYEIDQPLFAPPPEACAEMTQLFVTLTREALIDLPGQRDVVRAYTTVILTKVRQWLQSPSREGHRPARATRTLTTQFRRALEENFPRLMKVGDYARLLRTSRSRLNQKVRDDTGSTASDLIHQRVLLEARRLLIHSGATMSEIAYSLNFRDPSYFCRFFRKHLGVTPGAYRRRAAAR